MATTMPEMDDQRVEVRWKVTQGDDWFRPFRVLDDNGDDVTADCAVIAQARVAGVGRGGGCAAGGVGSDRRWPVGRLPRDPRRP